MMLFHFFGSLIIILSIYLKVDLLYNCFSTFSTHLLYVTWFFSIACWHVFIFTIIVHNGERFVPLKWHLLKIFLP